MEERDGRRIEAVERELAALSARMARIEQLLATEPVSERPVPAPPNTEAPRPRPAQPLPEPWTPPAAREAPRAANPSPRPPPPRPRPSIALEDLLGTRVLAALGGGAVFIGIAFFVAVAIGRGWIGEAERMLLAGGVSIALLALGVLLYERRGRTQAALALTGSAIGALYLTLTAATSLYDLVPTLPALALAFAVGALATALAVRWQSQLVAALGIVGALLAPVLVGAAVSGAVAAFVLIALAAAAAVLVAERWDWLAITAFAVAAPQIAAFALGPAEPVAIVVVASALWALGTAAALGFELRTAAAVLRPSSAFLVALSAVTAAAIGHVGLREAGDTGVADLWLAAVAIAQLGVAVSARSSPRASREIVLLSAGQAVVLGDLAFGLAVGGPALPVGWAAAALALTQLPRVLVPAGRLTPPERIGLDLALGSQLVLAIVHVLLFESPPSSLSGTLADAPGAALALGSVAVSAVLCARFTTARPVARDGFDIVAIAALAWLTAGVLDDVALTVAFALQGVALAEVARRSSSPVAAGGAGAFVALAFLHILAIDAPIDRIATDDPGDFFDGVVALATACACAFAAARLVPGRTLPDALNAGAVAGLTYLAAFALDGAFVVIAWVALAVALSLDAATGRDQLAAIGALGLLALAGLHALSLEAPPDSLLYGAGDPLAAMLALAALVAATALVARADIGPTVAGEATQSDGRSLQVALSAIAAGTLVYLGSVAIISAFQPDATSAAADLLNLDQRQQGQLVLSAFWAVAGLGALIAGLVRDSRPLRLGGFALLGLALAKVVAYDLSTLDSIYRVLSLIGVGLLLLAGAFVYQRLRPRSPERDLRDVRTP